MGTDLFERRGISPRYYIIFAIVVGVFFAAGVLIGWFSHTQPTTQSTSGQTEADDSSYFIDFILNNVNKDNIRNYLREYSKEPRLEGTEKDAELARLMQSQWQANGLDDVHLATYNVLLSFPNKTNPNVIQIKDTTSGKVMFETHKYEVVLTPAENNSDVVPPYNAYSPAADVTGDLIYVNYGRIEDFQLLGNMSVNFTGAIVIARYGKIFRGDKVKNAQRFNASGVILYSDPIDYNVGESKPYPDSWWLPPTGIQRGTVGSDGDQETPLYPSTYYANRVKATSLPTIPCQPIGYIDAIELLRNIAGPLAPEAWRGGLNITYNIGPGYKNNSTHKVRLNVNNYNEVRPVYNVIGLIRGSEEPDRYVLLGNHHDAWVFGAMDPLSGSASLTELTRVYGALLKQGHRPRRTIVFCSWDAEEQGLLGSVEWVEEHMKVLLQRGVVYLNVDITAIANYTLGIGSSPLLQDVAYESAKLVPSQDPAYTTFYDMWLSRPRSIKTVTEPDLYYSLGSGSDQGAFYQRAGVSCIDMWMTYDEARIPIPYYPLYHSSYETFYAFENFVDPGFLASAAITKFWGILASKMANSKLLPYKVERYSAAVSNFYSSLDKSSWQEHGVNVAAMDSAVHNFTKATKAFQQKLDTDASLLSSSLRLRMVNDRLMQLERAFLDPEGLPGQPAQKHVMFAPSQFDAYVDNSFPGIVDTVLQIQLGNDKWDQLKQQVYIATYTIQSAAFSLEDIGL